MAHLSTDRSRQTRRAARCHERRREGGESLPITAQKAALATHGQEVARLAARLGVELGLRESAVDHLRFAGLFHDVGKLWIPDSILEKDGPLTVAEWKVVRKHPEIGGLMLRAYGLEQEAEWVLYHHERPDGLGYPYGLCGDEIPLESRILAIADAWSAMRADRPYSPTAERVNARRELEFTRGEQFDAALVDLFLEVIEPELEPARESAGARGH